MEPRTVRTRLSCLAGLIVLTTAGFPYDGRAQTRPAAASAVKSSPTVASAPRPAPARKPKPKPKPGPAAAGSIATIGRANAQARDWPTAGAYVNSTIYYDYDPGRIYTIAASPRFLTTIALRPGEKLISKAAGDTVRWVMGETVTGSGASEQVIVLVKPIRPDLRTNIVLTTNQRTYLIDAVSGPGPAYTSVLAWNYPQEQARSLADPQARGDAKQVGPEVALEALDFNYRVATIKGSPPRWLPVRVFDDGAKTFIAFPERLATTEAPPLFLLGQDGRAELVNYRVQSGYYVVDRLIERAELRLGERKQTIVRISRTRPRT
jgi:type IV secretion system protein VirB9